MTTTLAHQHQKTAEARPPISLRLTPVLEAQLRARAEIEDRSLSSVVRQALRRHLQEPPD